MSIHLRTAQKNTLSLFEHGALYFSCCFARFLFLCCNVYHRFPSNAFLVLMKLLGNVEGNQKMVQIK